MVTARRQFDLAGRLFTDKRTVQHSALHLDIRVMITFRANGVVTNVHLLSGLINDLTPFNNFSIRVAFDRQVLGWGERYTGRFRHTLRTLNVHAMVKCKRPRKYNVGSYIHHGYIGGIKSTRETIVFLIKFTFTIVFKGIGQREPNIKTVIRRKSGHSSATRVMIFYSTRHLPTMFLPAVV